MRVLFIFLFTLFWLIPSAFSQGWKSSQPAPPRPIECGQTEQFSTWGQDNDFSGADYADCLPGVSDAYEGNDVVYKFTIEEESDIRFTIESMCAKGLFLFQEINGELKCLGSDELDPSEFGATKSFFGGIRVRRGDYFLVVDERASDMCEMFTLKLECTPFKPYTVCEEGGIITSCGKTISGQLPGEKIPPVIPMGEDTNLDILLAPPCDTIEYYQIFQAYFENPGAINTELSGMEGGSVLIFTEDCACTSSLICTDQINCEENGYGVNSLDNAIPGFYYFVVVGSPGESFDLKITTNDCLCDYTATPIGLNEPIIGDALLATNNFDNVVAQGLNAYTNCYGRERPYTGGDLVYEFEVNTQAKITINLESFFEAGLFLFDANCASDCLAYEETFGINGNANIFEFEVVCGVYQIVVDLAEPHAQSCPFTLEILAIEKVLDPVFIEDGLNSTIYQDMEFYENLKFNEVKLDGNRDNIVTFYTDNSDPKRGLKIVGEGYEVKGASVFYPVYGDDMMQQQKNGYNDQELFKQKLSKGTRDQGFVDAVITDNLSFLKIIEESTLGELSRVDTRAGIINNLGLSPVDRKVSSNGGSVNYTIFANQSADNDAIEVDWYVEPESAQSFIKVEPSTESGNKRIKANFEPNTSSTPRMLTFTLSGVTVGINREFTIVQESQLDCEEDTTPPTINCPLEQVFAIPNPSTNSILLLDQILRETGLTYSDNCTATKDLVKRFRTRPDTLDGNPQKIEIVISDQSGNENVCPIMVKAADSFGSKIASSRNTIINQQDLPLAADEGFEIYPNPNTGIFKISLPKQEAHLQEVSIFNSYGQLVKLIKNSNNSSVINFENINTGVYIIRVKSGDKISSKKMIISG